MNRLLAFVFLALVLLAQNSYAEDAWEPQIRHYEAAAIGGDCAIYRSLANKYRKTIEQADDLELHYSELLKVRRGDLAVCAEMRGFELDGSDESEALAAESCGEVYRQWVQTGYRLRASRQDRDSADKSVHMVTNNLERYCGQTAQLAPLALRVH
jgi:hypothetical protein